MKKILLAAAIITIAFTACKKSKVEEPAAPTIFGFWKGKYAIGANTPSLDIIYLVNPDNTIRVYNGTDTATASVRGIGSWNYDNTDKNKFETVYDYYTTTGTLISRNFVVVNLNADFKNMNGNWTSSNGIPAPMGTLIFSKQ
jgi:hypothetical protein